MNRRQLALGTLLAWMVSMVNPVLGVINEGNEVQFLAHRGGRYDFEENTMQAFKGAYAHGIRGFETDIRLNKDGEVVLRHDKTLERACGLKVRSEDKTNEEWRQIRTLGGQPLAFMQELVDFLADKEGMYVEWEIKTDPTNYTEEMLRVLCDKAYRMATAKKPESSLYLFTSFDVRALKIMQELHPEADLMLLKNAPLSQEILEEAQSMGIRRVAARLKQTTRETVELAQEQGMFVSLWPVQNKMDFLLGIAMGSNALCCDPAVELADWYREALPFLTVKGVAEPAEDAPKLVGQLY